MAENLLNLVKDTNLQIKSIGNLKQIKSKEIYSHTCYNHTAEIFRQK